MLIIFNSLEFNLCNEWITIISFNRGSVRGLLSALLRFHCRPPLQASAQLSASILCVLSEWIQKLETLQLFSELFFSPITLTFWLDGENTRFSQLSPPTPVAKAGLDFKYDKSDRRKWRKIVNFSIFKKCGDFAENVLHQAPRILGKVK